MIDKARIQAEADAFFEWPTADKSHVSTTSMLLFCDVIAQLVQQATAAECAKLCDEQMFAETRSGRAADCADAIRAKFAAKKPS